MATLPISADDELVDTSRFERIDGQLVARPMPNEDHALVQFAITSLLWAQAKPLGCRVLQEWTIDQTVQPAHDWMTPDVLLVENSRPRAASGHMLPPAILAVEVLSAGQTFSSMRLKALRYFQWGVEHVWIVDPIARNAMVLHAATPGQELPIFEGALEAGSFRLTLEEIFTYD